MYQKRQMMDNGIILFVDLIGVVISVAMAYWLRYHYILGSYKHLDQTWQISIMLLVSVATFFLNNSGYHFFRRGYFDECVVVLKEKLLFSVIWILILYLSHRSSDLSRLVFTYFIGINAVFTYLIHIGLKQILLRFYQRSKYSNRLLLVTVKNRVDDAIQNIVSYNEWSRILCGIVLLDEKPSEVGEIEGIPVVSDAYGFMDYVIHHDVDEVFLMDDDRRHGTLIESWIQQLETMGIVVDVNIDVFDLDIHGKKDLNRVGKYAVVTFARNVFSVRQMLAKRLLDIVGSLVGMVILALATVFVAPAIKLESPGPVFFGQTRIGKNGRKFTFYKFRSMYQDAEQRKKELMVKNEVQGLMFKMKDDPRITRVGKFIRKTSIDELPQFWNVLRGDMSLVGTRPPTVDEFEKYEAKHKCRLSMTPGLTGLWQISGRSDIKDFDEVVKLDMQYIDNWSIRKDIKILLKTVLVVLTGKGSR